MSKRYGAHTVLADVDLELRDGEAVLLMGANGAGKSTLLRILAGLAAPDAGTVEVDGRLGYAPQDGGLIDQLRPAEHFVLFGRGRGLSRARAVQEGRRLAEQLGWDALAAPVAGELSGGTRQKLNVILAALGEPDVLLLDEPYQGLDLDSVQRFWELLWAWRDDGALRVRRLPRPRRDRPRGRGGGAVIVAEMTLRGLARRRGTLVLLLALPLLFYAARHSLPGQSVRFLALGEAWAVSTLALFAALAARSTEPRLRVGGWSWRALLAGRVAGLPRSRSASPSPISR